MAPVTGHLPAAWRRWFPTAFQDILPKGDLHWTVTDVGILLSPATGICPRCHTEKHQWHWWEGQWICDACWGEPPAFDPKLQLVWEWMEQHRQHFWPYTSVAEAWGHWSRRGIRPTFHPPQWTDATWQQQLRHWRVWGYLNVQDPPRLTRYVLCDRRGDPPYGMRVILFYPHLWQKDPPTFL